MNLQGVSSCRLRRVVVSLGIEFPQTLCVFFHILSYLVLGITVERLSSQDGCGDSEVSRIRSSRKDLYALGHRRVPVFKCIFFHGRSSQPKQTEAKAKKQW